MSNWQRGPRTQDAFSLWQLINCGVFFLFLVFPFANLQSQIKTISIFSAPINDSRGGGGERGSCSVDEEKEKVHTWDTLGQHIVNLINLLLISFIDNSDK